MYDKRQNIIREQNEIFDTDGTIQCSYGPCSMSIFDITPDDYLVGPPLFDMTPMRLDDPFYFLVNLHTSYECGEDIRDIVLARKETTFSTEKDHRDVVNEGDDRELIY